MPLPRTLIAVVDDDTSVRVALQRLLRSAGFDVCVFDSGTRFLDSAASTVADCVVLDLHMPDVSGFDVQDRLWARASRPAVVAITGHDAPGVRARVLAQGAHAYLCKPIDKDTLIDAVRCAISSPSPSSK
jgi:FixJ family two-component response regulator